MTDGLYRYYVFYYQVQLYLLSNDDYNHNTKFKFKNKKRPFEYIFDDMIKHTSVHINYY